MDPVVGEVCDIFIMERVAASEAAIIEWNLAPSYPQPLKKILSKSIREQIVI